MPKLFNFHFLMVFSSTSFNACYIYAHFHQACCPKGAAAHQAWRPTCRSQLLATCTLEQNARL